MWIIHINERKAERKQGKNESYLSSSSSNRSLNCSYFSLFNSAHFCPHFRDVDGMNKAALSPPNPIWKFHKAKQLHKGRALQELIPVILFPGHLECVLLRTSIFSSHNNCYKEQRTEVCLLVTAFTILFLGLWREIFMCVALSPKVWPWGFTVTLPGREGCHWRPTEEKGLFGGCRGHRSGE